MSLAARTTSYFTTPQHERLRAEVRAFAEAEVAPEVAGNVDRGAAGLGEELAERRSGNAESNCPQPAGIEWVGQCAAQMGSAGRLGMGDPDIREGEARGCSPPSSFLTRSTPCH